MRLKVCVEEGESTPHKPQRALSCLGAGLEGTAVSSSPGDNGSKRDKKKDGE